MSHKAKLLCSESVGLEDAVTYVSFGLTVILGKKCPQDVQLVKLFIFTLLNLILGKYLFCMCKSEPVICLCIGSIYIINISL